MSEITPSKKAYLYSRVSSDKQTGENSTGLDRQLELAQTFLKSHSEYTLADSYIDSGVSSYHGSNLVEEAGLARFIANCEAGLIEEDSLLIIEAPDRLSRLGIRKGQELFSKLLDYKINIGLVKYNTIIKHNDDNDIANSLIVSIGLYLGHLESEQKSARIKQAFKIKQSKGQHASGNFPKWLTLSEDRTTFDVIPQHKNTLEKIFKLRLDGWGSLRIASYLNEHLDKYPPITGKPRHTKSIVEKYLKTKSVYGTWERQKTVYEAGKRKKGEVLEVLENYFPAVIPYETWVLANNKQRKVQGKVNREFTNLFRGLLFCTSCGNTCTVSKPQRGKTKILCKGRVYHKNNCTMQNAYYEDFEESLLKWLTTFDFSTLHTDAATIDKSEIQRLESELIEEQQAYDNYLEAIAIAPSIVVVNALTSKLENAQISLDAKREELDKAYVDFNVSIENTNELPPLDTVEERQAFHNYISKFIKSIGIDNTYIPVIDDHEDFLDAENMGEFSKSVWVQTQRGAVLLWEVGKEDQVSTLDDMLTKTSSTSDLKSWFANNYAEEQTNESENTYERVSLAVEALKIANSQ